MNIIERLTRRRRRLSCHEVGEVLQTWLDDELDVTAARRVAAHLEDCRRCGLEAETYRALKVALHEIPLSLPNEPVARLRTFGERLTRGDLGPEGVPVS